MKIAFLGQLGLPRLLDQDTASRERRVAALAALLAGGGHEAVVFGTPPYLLQSGNWNGVTTRSVPSLDPTRPGGWFYLVLSAMYLVSIQPNVVHVHGYPAAAVSLLLKVMLPKATFVWTVDRSLRGHRFLVRPLIWLLSLPFACITAPTRRIQYWLYASAGQSAQYIPDGYTPHTRADTLERSLRLTPGGYAVAIVDTPRAARAIARAFQPVRDGKRLVILPTDTVPAYTRLARQYRFVKIAAGLSGARRAALITQAAAVVAADDGQRVPDVFAAMAAARPVIATPRPPYQEVLGTTGQFVQLTDQASLAAALAAALGSDAHVQRAARAGQRRARHHFTWERILADYESAYRAPAALVTPLDSARAVRFTQKNMPAIQVRAVSA